MNNSRWLNVELEMLEQMAIDYPPDQLAAVYNQWAQSQNLTLRTKAAVEWMANKRGMRERACGDWVSTGYICQVLGISFNTPQRWSDQYGIPCHKDGRGRRFFLRSELRRVAKQQPVRFAGIAADRLFLLLEDRNLADAVAAAFPRRPMAPRRIRCIETGWMYPSVKSACRRIGIPRGAIQRAIRTGGTAAGYHWSYAS